MGRKKIYLTDEERAIRHRIVAYTGYIKKKMTPEYIELEKKKQYSKTIIKQNQQLVKEYIKQQAILRKEDRVFIFYKLTNGECKTPKQFANKYNLVRKILLRTIREMKKNNIEITIENILSEYPKMV